MNRWILGVTAAMVALLWVPIILRFYGDYRRRPKDERHPASLAIVSALSILIFHALTTFVRSDHGWQFTRLCIFAAELICVAQFWVAFKVGQRRLMVSR